MNDFHAFPVEKILKQILPNNMSIDTFPEIRHLVCFLPYG